MSKITPEQRVQKAVVAIMHNPRYRRLAGILMVGERNVTDNVRGRPITTACTNGKDEYYSPDFIAKLTDPELRFLILHEVYHKLYRHLTTWRWMYDRNHTAANMACDYVINIKLVDDNADGFATMTGALKGGCIDTKYRDWDSAAVFHDLLKNAKESGGGANGSDSGQGGEQRDGQGQGQGQGFDEHDWDTAEGMTDEQKRELAREIDNAIRQGAIIAGKSGSGGERDMAELLQPKVDWRTALRDFVTTTCAGSDFSTWKRPNRRFIGAGHYMPSGISERVKDLVLAIDTSGSIGGPSLNAFLSEVKAIADTVKPERVHVLYWDTEVCQHEVYTEADMQNLISSTKPKGGGGTLVECVTKYMAEHGIAPQAAIILTDGYLGGTWGVWSCPTLWCILDNRSAVPGIGSTVHIASRGM